MKDWKQRLYDSYISTGQADINIIRQAGLNIDHYPYFSRLIKKYLPDRKDISILDLACGHGALIYCLKKRGYCNVEGVDVSPQQVDLAHKLGLKEVKCQNIKDFLVDKVDVFDVVFLMDILEHLNKAELLDWLDRINQSLTKNGIVVIHIPNAEGIFGMRVRYGDLTHENCFTTQSIKQVLSACGFNSVECFEESPVIHSFFSLVRYVTWIVLTMPLRLLSVAETGSFRQVFSQNMLVIAKK